MEKTIHGLELVEDFAHPKSKILKLERKHCQVKNILNLWAKRSLFR